MPNDFTAAHRIAVVSDIHGNVAALEAVLHDVAGSGVDEVINLGDTVSGALWPAETVALLMREDWRSVRGNHDRTVVAGGRVGPSDAHARASLRSDQIAWLAGLPERIDVASGVVAVHGSLRADDEYLTHSIHDGVLRLAQPEEVEVRLGSIAATTVLCGHTHLPAAVRAAGGALVIGAGSVGLQAYEDDDLPLPHVVENGTPDASYALIDFAGPPSRLRVLDVRHRRVRYDHESAARRADEVGRPDVAFALRTGQTP